MSLQFLKDVENQKYRSYTPLAILFGKNWELISAVGLL